MTLATVLAPRLNTTQLGFGSSNLGGRLGRRQSLSILETAFDAGIRHFDTAPLYGYGETEGVLGEFLKGRRDQVTVATKFGILPPKRSPSLRLKKSVARAAVAVFPQLRARIRRRAEGLTSRGNFTVLECRQTLQNSLHQLNTDYVDVLLMHEVEPDQITSELVDFLEDAKHRGLVRHYGTATTVDSTISMNSRQLPNGDVAQFPSSIFENTLQMLPLRDTPKIVITHSSLGEKFHALSRRLTADDELRSRWSKQLGFDCARASQLGALLLAAAMKENPEGIVLFSSQTPSNIRENAALLHEQKFSAGQFFTVKALVQAFIVAAEQAICRGMSA